MLCNKLNSKIFWFKSICYLIEEVKLVFDFKDIFFFVYYKQFGTVLGLDV